MVHIEESRATLSRTGSEPASAVPFVGRERELELLESLTGSAQPRPALVVLSGTPGIGKTSLLRQFALRCDQRGVPCASILERETISDAALTADELGPRIEDQLAGGAGSGVVLIDDADRLAPGTLPRLVEGRPTELVFIVTSTSALGLEAQLSAMPSSEVRYAALGPLDGRSSERLLELRGIPREQSEAICSFAQGYPLAMTMLAQRAEEDPTWRFDPRYEMETIRRLAERLMPAHPDSARLAALDLATVCHTVTEDVIAEVLERSDARLGFQWLAQLPFMRAVAEGLSMEPFARHILDRDLEWRRPDRRTDLIQRARTYYWDRIPHLSDWAHESNLLALKFLRRGRRVPVEMWDVDGLTISALRPGDDSFLAAMAEQWEGPSAAAAVGHWLQRQPGAFSVVRGRDKQPRGFLAFLSLADIDAEDRAMDPAVEAAWTFMHQHLELREQNHARLTRFLMSEETYDDFSPTQNLLMNRMTLNEITTPQLAYTFWCYLEPVKWEAGRRRYGAERLADAAFVMDGRPFAMFGRDWRLLPVWEWFESISLLPMTDLPATWRDRSRLVLDWKAFRHAVLEALDGYHDLNALATNALLRTEMVLGRSSPNASTDERVQVLRALIAQAADEIPNSARALRAGDLLQWTHIEAKGTQREVARMVDLPFSTYRHHVSKARDLLAEHLWAQEATRPTKPAAAEPPAPRS